MNSLSLHDEPLQQAGVVADEFCDINCSLPDFFLVAYVNLPNTIRVLLVKFFHKCDQQPNLPLVPVYLVPQSPREQSFEVLLLELF